MMKESPLMMLLHGLIIGVVAYFVLTLLLKNNQHVATCRAVVIGCSATIYMVLFGHKLPQL